MFARRLNKQFSLFKRLTSWGFNRFLGLLMGARLDSTVGNFSVISRQVVLNLRAFKERNRTYALFVRWMGFDVAYVDIEHRERFAGQTTYSLGKMMLLATEAVISQSDKPLRLSIQFGLAVALLAFAGGAWRIIGYLLWGIPVPGWTSVIVSIYLLGGLGFVNLGIVGLYIGKIFDETRRRPLYIVKEALNVPPRDE